MIAGSDLAFYDLSVPDKGYVRQCVVLVKEKNESNKKNEWIDKI